jgi:hypothetical protein
MVVGVAAAAIATAAASWYLYTIIRRQTRPHRVTFAVWTLAGVLGISSSFDAGAGAGAYVATVYAAFTAVVFLLCLVPGFGKPNAERPSDWLLGMVSCATLLAWSLTPLPTAAAATVAVGADAAIAWPTIREAWRQPYCEAVGPWIVGMIGSSLALAAIRHVSYASMAYPAYIALLELVVAAILLARGRARQPVLEG